MFALLAKLFHDPHQVGIVSASTVETSTFGAVASTTGDREVERTVGSSVIAREDVLEACGGQRFALEAEFVALTAVDAASAQYGAFAAVHSLERGVRRGRPKQSLSQHTLHVRGA